MLIVAVVGGIVGAMLANHYFCKPPLGTIASSTCGTIGGILFYLVYYHILPLFGIHAEGW